MSKCKGCGTAEVCAPSPIGDMYCPNPKCDYGETEMRKSVARGIERKKEVRTENVAKWLFANSDFRWQNVMREPTWDKLTDAEREVYKYKAVLILKLIDAGDQVLWSGY